MSNTRKPVKFGADYVRGSNWEPRRFSRKGAERYASQEAAKRQPRGFWTGRVSDCGDYYRINICGQPF